MYSDIGVQDWSTRIVGWDNVGWEIFGWDIVSWDNVQVENCWVGNCLSEILSVWEIVKVGFCRSGKLLSGIDTGGK